MVIIRSYIILTFVLSVLVLGCSKTTPLINPISEAVQEKETFINGLPNAVKSEILWFSDYEDGSFEKWEDQGTSTTFAGGGIFNTDDTNVSFGIDSIYSNSGKHSSFAEIRNATNPGEPKAVRFMRWTNKAWDEDGDYLPSEAYYSVFFYFPEIYNPAKPTYNDPLNDGGWWNIFQFKSDNNAGSQPLVVLDLYHENGKMVLGMVLKDYPNNDSEEHILEYLEQSEPLPINSKEWVHLEAYYKKSKEYDGEVKVWQNGKLILEKSNFRTVLPPGETAVWGIGNYTDYIDGGDEAGKAILFYDDAIICSVSINEHLD